MEKDRANRTRIILQILKNEKVKEFLIIGIPSLLIVSLLLIRTEKLVYDHALFNENWDHHKYIAMAAGNPFDFHIAPFCWRIGTPVLAKALPLDLQDSFTVISFISIWMTGVLVYYLARIFEFSKTYAFVGMLMFFSLKYATKLYLFIFWAADPLSFLFIVLSIWCILSKKDMLFLLVLMTGVTVKESVIFAAPLYYTFNARKLIDGKLAIRMLLLVAPAASVLISLRLGIPKMNNDVAYLSTLPEKLRIVQEGTSSYGYLALLREIGLQRVKMLSLSTLGDYTIGTFGVVLMSLPFFSVKRNIELFLRFIPFLALVGSQLLFAVGTNRLLALGFPAIILMALNGVFVISETLGVGPKYFVIVSILVFGMSLISLNPFFSNPTYDLLFEALIFIMFLALSISHKCDLRNRKKLL
jgi:hypothetical protein